MMTIHFLGVAINDYPGTANDLQMPREDLRKVLELLKIRANSLGADTRLATLVDSAATSDTFVTMARRSLLAAEAGDHVLWYYSGHGTKVPGEEEDGYDEALFLYDGPFLDNAVRNLIDNYLKEGVRLTVILDCCFSGTATRNARTTSRVKYADFQTGKTSSRIGMRKAEKEGKVRRFLGINQRIENPSELAKVMTWGGSGAKVTELYMPEILMAACASHEVAYEDQVGGVFTTALCNLGLVIAGYNATYYDVMVEIAKALPSKRFPQTPQLEATTHNKYSRFLGPESPMVDPETPATKKSWFKRLIEKIVAFFKNLL